MPTIAVQHDVIPVCQNSELEAGEAAPANESGRGRDDDAILFRPVLHWIDRD